MSYTPGPTQIAILRTVAGGKGFVCATAGQYRSALKLADHGLLDRDRSRGASRRFIGNDAGTRYIQEHDTHLARKAGWE